MKNKLSLLSVTACALLFAAAHARAADPIVFGMMSESTGPSSESGVYQANGATLAVEELNKSGGVLGRQIKLINEDNQSTNPGSVLAISKLTSENNPVALLSTVRSTQIQAISPTVIRAGLPIMVGGTNEGLTHMNNPWIFRTRPHDGYSAKVIADFGLNTLKLKKWAVINSTDAFGNGGKDLLVDALKAKGITPVLVQGFPSNSQDFTPIILAIKNAGADIVASYIATSTDVAIFGKQLRQLGVTAAWIGSPSVSTATALKLGGEAMYGSYSVADFTPDASPEAQAYSAAYRAAYHVEPDFYSSWAYDSVKLLAKAIEASHSTDPATITKALHDIKDYKGVEGTYNFDANGDGLHGYNIVKNEAGTIVFDKHIEQ